MYKQSHNKRFNKPIINLVNPTSSLETNNMILPGKAYYYSIEISEEDIAAGYEYVINSNITRIPFTSFKEVGLTGNVNYSESSIGSESYSFIFDFSSCDINTDYRNVYVYLEGINNSSVIRPTIERSSFSLLSSGNVELTHSITTEFNGSITYKSD